MKLTVYERLILLNILPITGDITTERIVGTLREDLGFTETEYKVLRFKQAGDVYKNDAGKAQVVAEGQIQWQAKGDKEKEIRIGAKATDIIVGRLKKLYNEKILEKEQMPLYEKFIAGGRK